MLYRYLPLEFIFRRRSWGSVCGRLQLSNINRLRIRLLFVVGARKLCNFIRFAVIDSQKISRIY